MAQFTLVANPARREAWGGMTIEVTRNVLRRTVNVSTMAEAETAWRAFQDDARTFGSVHVGGYFFKRDGKRIPAGCKSARFEAFLSMPAAKPDGA